MQQWEGATKYEQRQYLAIAQIFQNNSKLLEFFFSLTQPRLSRPPEQILKDARVFSSGEQVLVSVALDIWDGSGATKLMDVFAKLETSQAANILKTLMNFQS